VNQGRAFTVIDTGPRTLTYTLYDGREVMVTLLTSGEVALAERWKADPYLPWSAPIQPTSDSAVQRG
jgi:hypothetical protein